MRVTPIELSPDDKLTLADRSYFIRIELPYEAKMKILDYREHLLLNNGKLLCKKGERINQNLLEEIADVSTEHKGMNITVKELIELLITCLDGLN